MGNLTRDPEVRVTPKGTALCTFGIAVNRTYKNEAGQQVEEVNFFDIECWGKIAEVIGKFFTKGKPIFIQGRLKLDTWDDKATGTKRSKVKVVLEQFQFLGGRNDDYTPSQAAPAQRSAFGTPPPRVQPNIPPAVSQAQDAIRTARDVSEDIDDIPF